MLFGRDGVAANAYGDARGRRELTRNLPTALITLRPNAVLGELVIDRTRSILVAATDAPSIANRRLYLVGIIGIETATQNGLLYIARLWQ